jgi:hypothetical protein
MRTRAYWGCPLRDAPFSGPKFASDAVPVSAAGRITNVRHKDHPSLVCAVLLRVLQYRHGAGLATFPPSKERRPGLLLALIHPTAWKVNSRNFACAEFHEVHYLGDAPRLQRYI